MRKICTLIALCLFLSLPIFAQIISISGHVKDVEPGLPVPGATLKIGSTGTSTDKGGGFNLVLEKAVVAQYGIVVSCIGYQKAAVAYQAGNVYHITLRPAVNALAGVTVAVGESIIQKTIRRIPQNYPVNDFMMEGFLRGYQVTKDSVAYHKYYKNDAVIKMHYPSYKNTEDPQVVLLQNKATDVSNVNHNNDTLRWVNGYLVVSHMDMVHARSYILAANGAKKYTYVINGKDQVNGCRVYVVNFFSVKQNDKAGTLYIDTATYAIVKTELTLYNQQSLTGLEFKKSFTFNYKKINGRWYIDNVKAHAVTERKGISQSASIDYKTTSIDTLHTETLAYRDVIQNWTEDAKINNPGTPEIQAKYAGLFKSSATDTLFTQIPVPVVDTIKNAATKRKNTLRSIFHYIQNGNIRTILSVSKLPLTLAQVQPLLNSNVDDIAGYSFGAGDQFRLYKNLFFEYDLKFNFGIGGLKNNQSSVSVLYNFELNKHHRLITVSPSFGYSNLTLSKNGTDYFKQSDLVPGLCIAIDRIHKLSYFVQVKYYNNLDTQNQGIQLTQQKFTPTIGLMLK